MGARSRLTAIGIERLKKRGRYADGGGLYLQVTVGASGVINKSWLLRCGGREMGLGSYHDVSLAEARDERDKWRAVHRKGGDPMAARAKEREPKASMPTFGTCCDEFIASREAGWTAKTSRQWRNGFANHAPALSAMPVNEVSLELILAVLKPIWTMIPQTAGRIRNRIEAILDMAEGRGFRSGENPASWRRLKHWLDKQVTESKHHEALDYREIPEFMRELRQWKGQRQRKGIARPALEFIILTAARLQEVIGATWDEIDLAEGVWDVPACRMKARRKHTVPLSGRAIEILESLPRSANDPRVFPIADVGVRRMLQHDKLGLGRKSLTIHGFRSTFADWRGDATDFPKELAEAALAHILGETERAYRRSDAFVKRRALMQAWAAYCDRAENVIPLPARA